MAAKLCWFTDAKTKLEMSTPPPKKKSPERLCWYRQGVLQRLMGSRCLLFLSWDLLGNMGKWKGSLQREKTGPGDVQKSRRISSVRPQFLLANSTSCCLRRQWLTFSAALSITASYWSGVFVLLGLRSSSSGPGDSVPCLVGNVLLPCSLLYIFQSHFSFGICQQNPSSAASEPGENIAGNK